MSRQSDVRECTLLACHRVGLYPHISEPDSSARLRAALQSDPSVRRLPSRGGAPPQCDCGLRLGTGQTRRASGLERPHPAPFDSGGIVPASRLRDLVAAPVSGNMLLNIHHAGLWNRPDGASGDFHALWDLALEVDMGGVTYLVGYQRGSAAPTFVPIETTRAGLSFAVGGGTAGSAGPDAD